MEDRRFGRENKARCAETEDGDNGGLEELSSGPRSLVTGNVLDNIRVEDKGLGRENKARCAGTEDGDSGTLEDEGNLKGGGKMDDDASTSLEDGEGIIKAGSYTVESGTLSNIELPTSNVLVVAELIPSWLLLLGDTLRGNQNVLLWIDDGIHWFLRNLPQSWNTVDSLEDVGRKVSELPPTSWTILVQGSSSFASRFSTRFTPIVSALGFHIQDSFSVVALTGRPQTAHFPWVKRWRTLNHHDVGGVTTNKCSIGTTGLDSCSFVRSTIRRTLSTVLKFDVGGQCVQAPDGNSNCLQSPIRITQLLDSFVVPSAFSTSGWVKRSLTFKEIGSCLDLPPGMLGQFSIWAKLEPTLLNRIIRVPPIKIIQACIGVFSLQPSSSSVRSADSRRAEMSDVSRCLGVPSVVEQTAMERYAHAVKGDDVATDSRLWDIEAVTPPELGDSSSWSISQPSDISASHLRVFEFLRERMAREFSRNVTKSFRTYLETVYPRRMRLGLVPPSKEFSRDIEVGRDCIQRARACSFWEWHDGSTIFFWRWPEEIRSEVRDGTPLCIKGRLPAFKQRQRMPKDPARFSLLKAKVDKVRRRRYLVPGHVKSLTNFFDVPKGESDIRIVYDMTASGLNEALWAPTFFLPTVSCVLDCATHLSWFGDIDAGDMFLNYPLDLALQPYAGVDVSWDSDSVLWLRWVRMAMGFVSSPFVACRQFSWAMEVIRGDRHCSTNPFHWSHVRLNLPGMSTYDSSLPRVFKWNPVTRSIAADACTYVDDTRTVGPSRAAVRAVTHRIESMMGYLGLQDATRKRRPEARRPGEWTGSITVASPGVGLFVTVSQKKWDKAKGHLQWVLQHFSSPHDRPSISLKELEQRVGFLVHLAMAYPLMLPFLKGFYLSMNSWRPFRRDSGWKMSKRCLSAALQAARRNGSSSSIFGHSSRSGAPLTVRSASLLFEHASTLHTLFSASTPSCRLIRGSSSFEVCYFFGDASGDGFGASWWSSTSGPVAYRFGIWGCEGRNTSSNFRELRNLVETLESMSSGGGLEGKAVFVFTDNMVSETVAAKGSSACPLLYDLVSRLYHLEMTARCQISMIHVAGTRMIAQGTDGLSRGDMFEGVMKGESMLSHIPLHTSAIDRCGDLLQWIKSWACELGNDVELLNPDGWYERGHDIAGSTANVDGIWMPTFRRGTFVWAPPPGAARQAIEQLRQARHKRQESSHIFVCPRLLWSEWRRHLYKSADLIFTIPAGSVVWPHDMHESLIVAVYFPYLHRAPWELRGTDLLVELAGTLQRVLKKSSISGGDILSKFCLFTRRMDCLPLCELRKVLQGKRGLAFSH